LNELRKRQGFSKVARAFMAINEDIKLAKISTSVIQPSNGTDSLYNSGTNNRTKAIPDTITPLTPVIPPPETAPIKIAVDDFFSEISIRTDETC
jgi:hypothetical protein